MADDERGHGRRNGERVPDDAGKNAALEALWNHALATWQDDAAHVALLEHALRTEQLPEIAGRYRALLGDPERSVVAKKRLDGIVLAATQLLMSMKTPRPSKVPLPITLSAVSVSMLLLFWLWWVVFGHH